MVVKGKEAVRAKMLEIQQKGKEASAKDNASYATLQIVNEMLARGIEVLPIDIYKSDARKYFGGDGKSVCRFGSLPGVGGAAAASLGGSKGKRWRIYLCRRFQARAKVGKAVIETLKRTGAVPGLARQQPNRPLF